jgi:DNA-binding PadR family transcriptional regulator
LEAIVSVRHALLALLSEGPKHGTQLRDEFEARTGEVWPLNVGQVYTTLQRLERDGLIATAPDVESDEEGTQKPYRITEAGSVELAHWLRTPPDLSTPPRDELVMKVLVALRVPGTDVRDVIQAHRRYLVELMQRWTRIKEDDAGDDLNMQLAVDAELFRLHAVIGWLDTAEARIARARTDGMTDWRVREERDEEDGSAQPAPSEETRAPLPRHRRKARTP